MVLEDSFNLKKLHCGSEEAFGFFYKKYYWLIYATAYSYAPRKEDAEDITCDVFATLWSKREEISIRQSVPAFLKTVAYHIAADYLKKRPVNVAFEEASCSVGETVSTAQIDAMRLAKGLTAEEFTVLYLRDVGELTFREIGKEIGRSGSAARDFYERSLKKAQEILGVMAPKKEPGGKPNG